MSVYWNSRVRAAVPYTPGEQPKEGGLIKLNTNENPYPPSPAALEAARAAADDRLRLYPDPSCAALRDAIASVCAVNRAEVFAGNGSDEILAFAFAAFFESGDGAPPVLFPDVTYSFYPVYAALWNVPFREVPLDGEWCLRLEDYEEPSGGVVFPNPNAPTGRAVSVGAVAALAERLARRNTVLIVDEAYAAFAGEDCARLVREMPNLLLVRTFSKAHSLAGMRVGYALGSAGLIGALERIRDSVNSYTVDAVAQAAARAAILDEDYYRRITEAVVKTRERAAAELAAKGFVMPPSRANFLFLKHPTLGGAAFYAALREKGILTRHFQKPRIDGFIRVSVGSDAEMDRFLACCAALAGSPR